MEDTVYLGDGAYVKKLADEDIFVVYAHNGSYMTDQIYLDPDVARKLKDFLVEKLTKS